MSGGLDSQDVAVAEGGPDDAPADGMPSSSEGAARAPDLDGLLCALVLAPGMYSRNRFFRMFEDAGARRVRRRATHVRSIIRMLRGRSEAACLAPSGAPAAEDGAHEIAVHVPALGLTRRMRLAPLELALVRYALKIGDDDVRGRDKDAVEGSLARLSPVG